MAVCSNGCGRRPAEGFPTCCRTCGKSGGRAHGPTCVAALAASLDAGKDLGSRLDFAPFNDQNASTDFEGNKQWLGKCLKLVQTQEDFRNITDICGPPPEGLVDYVRGLTPVHRMNETVFRAVLRDGGLRSRALQKSMRQAGPAGAAATRLRSHPILGGLARQMGLRLRDMHLLMDAARPMLELELEDLNPRERTSKLELRSQRLELLRDTIGAGPQADNGIAILESLVKDVAEHTRSAGDLDTGVGYKRDGDLGTDKHVFSIVGANMCEGYGDFVFILSPRIMQHPDFNMSITAATSYMSRRTYFHRPWVALGKVVNYVPSDTDMHFEPRDRNAVEPGAVQQLGADDVLDTVKVLRNGEEVPFTDEEMLEHFQKSKLHPCAVDWEHVVALDLALQCRLFLMSKRELDTWVDRYTAEWRNEFVLERLGGRTPSVKDVSADIVKTWYTKINAHGCIEGHLPEFVPLDYIDKLLMPTDRYEALKEELERIVLADNTTLRSRVVCLPAGAQYANRVRAWQEEYFDMRGRERSAMCGVGSALDMRAFSFGVEGLRGKETFLPMKFLNPTSGFLVKFRVKGQHIRLTFVNRREATRDKPADGALHVYLLCIGLFENHVTYLRRSNKAGDPTCLEVRRDKRPDAMAQPDRYREYWVNFNVRSGRLQLGSGEIGTSTATLLDWTDPTPHRDIQYMAVGCWDTPVDFAMLKYSEPLH